jgi:hypothetical protein
VEITGNACCAASEVVLKRKAMNAPRFVDLFIWEHPNGTRMIPTWMPVIP